MEFEHNKPATAQDIAMAEIPKVTLQPVHMEIQPQTVTTNHAHTNEAVFAFETDSTTPENVEAVGVSHGSSNAHHATALLIATGCTLLFCGAIAAVYLLR